MTQYNTLNGKLSNSQLNKLKSGIKNNAQVNLNLSSNAVGESNDDTNFPHKLLLSNTQVSRIHTVLPNGSLTNIEFSKTRLSKMIQLGGCLSNYVKILDSTMRPIAKKGVFTTKNTLENLF